MKMLYLLIPIGLITLVIAIKVLFWAISNGQYDDLDTEGQRILFDEGVNLSQQQDPSKVQDASEKPSKTHPTSGR